MSTAFEILEDKIVQLVYISGHRLSGDVTNEDIVEAAKAYRDISSTAGHAADMLQRLIKGGPT